MGFPWYYYYNHTLSLIEVPFQTIWQKLTSQKCWRQFTIVRADKKKMWCSHFPSVQFNCIHFEVKYTIVSSLSQSSSNTEYNISLKLLLLLLLLRLLSFVLLLECDAKIAVRPGDKAKYSFFFRIHTHTHDETTAGA